MYQGADISSDHSLVLSKFKVRLRRKPKGSTIVNLHLNTDELNKSNHREEICQSLQQKLEQDLQPEDLDEKTRWLTDKIMESA